MRGNKNYTLKREMVAQDPNLGRVADGHIGKKHNVSKAFVRNLRHELGIDPVSDWRKPPPKGSPAKDKVLENKHLLGVYSDNSIGKLLGIHKESVRRVRAALGVKPGLANAVESIIILSEESKLLESWPCIPERVGLTRNEWRKKCASM